jgi:methionyl-tRNA formyltransferase
MRVVILTSSRTGTASYCLPLLLSESKAEIVQVIYSEGMISNRKKYYRQKIKKIARIGFFGALNGIRIRKWFSLEAIKGERIEDIEKICEKAKIPFAVTQTIGSSETVGIMKSCAPDLGLSLGNSYIPSKVFSIPGQGMLNIHGEILPEFQNAQSVIWQLYEGSRMTGYTIHKIDRKIDEGDILKQEKFPILFKPTLKATVAHSCAEILRRAAIGLIDVLDHFDQYDLQSQRQGKGRTYTTPSIRQFMRIVRNYKRLRKEL